MGRCRAEVKFVIDTSNINISSQTAGGICDTIMKKKFQQKQGDRYNCNFSKTKGIEQRKNQVPITNL